MPTTTPYGYKKPITNERGYFDSLEHNIDRTDAHTHNGVDSAPIPSINISKSTATINAGSWAAVVGKSGLYSQTVTLPFGYDYANVNIKFFVSGGGEDGAELFLSLEKISSTQYKVYINDNTLTLKAVYA